MNWFLLIATLAWYTYAFYLVHAIFKNFEAPVAMKVLCAGVVLMFPIIGSIIYALVMRPNLRKPYRLLRTHPGRRW